MTIIMPVRLRLHLIYQISVNNVFVLLIYINKKEKRNSFNVFYTNCPVFFLFIRVEVNWDNYLFIRFVFQAHQQRISSFTNKCFSFFCIADDDFYKPVFRCSCLYLDHFKCII